MRVRWSPSALRDLKEIGAFISRDNPEAARRWVDRLQERGELVIETPRAARKVPEFDRDDIREVFLKGYRIVYSIGPEEIAIIAVLEGHRLFPKGRVKPIR